MLTAQSPTSCFSDLYPFHGTALSLLWGGFSHVMFWPSVFFRLLHLTAEKSHVMLSPSVSFHFASTLER